MVNKCYPWPPPAALICNRLCLSKLFNLHSIWTLCSVLFCFFVLVFTHYSYIINTCFYHCYVIGFLIFLSLFVSLLGCDSLVKVPRLVVTWCIFCIASAITYRVCVQWHFAPFRIFRTKQWVTCHPDKCCFSVFSAAAICIVMKCLKVQPEFGLSQRYAVVQKSETTLKIVI